MNRLRTLLGAQSVWILIPLFGGAGLLSLLLSAATANTTLFAEHYPRLLMVGAFMALMLMGLIAYQLVKLFRKLRQRVFGSKLTVKLVLLLAGMAVLPGTLVYGVSVRFLSSSIESWFDVNIDTALTAGLGLGRTAFDSMLDDLVHKAGVMSGALAEVSAMEEASVLYQLREQFGVQEATLLSKNGTVLAFSSARNDVLIPQGLTLNSTISHQIRSQRPYKIVETLPGKGVFLRVLVPVNRMSFTEDLRILQLIEPVPKEMAANADSVESAYRGYQELLLARHSLKNLYRLNLSLVLLLTLLTAIVLAFVISEWLGAPLNALAASTRAVGAGDFSVTTPVSSNDELGVLTASFNTMTEQLREAAVARQRYQQELTDAKEYQESILSNLSAGVMVLDGGLCLKSANLSAQELLGLRGLEGLSLKDWGKQISSLMPITEFLQQNFSISGSQGWEGEADRHDEQGRRRLHFRGSRLPDNLGGDWILVFDDITQMVQAQRDAAWGEVARRLAHEIKNPLTPIQLSAERLQHRLRDRLPPAEAELLKRSTATIINQVDALKNMVNDFSEYARSSLVVRGSLSLNDLIREILVLYEGMGERIHTQLDPDLPPLTGDTTRLRQVIHNLLQNALDEGQSREDFKVMLTTAREHNWARLSVTDNGQGFSVQVVDHVFEPYITTKTKGTGLGLPIVKKIVEEHHGRIRAFNEATGGATVEVLLPIGEGEKG
ncbi:MAG: HAMP domain-containing protein [Ferrovum sp.]|nr:HAMP domain-containing protein [Ferrovum sp.]